MNAFQAGYSQKVSLGVAPQIANSTHPLIIQRFKQLQPDVITQIEILPSNEIGEAVFRQQIDIGLSKVPSPRELLTTVIANEPVMIVGPQPFIAEEVEKGGTVCANSSNR
ncbi:LysR substrate-binding domain-containing protein [Virgibacillus halophilus]|uniref:LysR substrate-binding domain-containing protein n=1 Tax=Tigheibacillus halophilus TaxID=361280 RepID=A0ABU5C5W6_9BACI|nr:LysR substrate-binding domain-containing protein [Virgibacillus halophilus]